MDTQNAYRQLTNVTTGLIQGQMIGFDGVEALLPPGVAFANAATVHETSTAEMTLALILAAQRGIPDFVRDAERGQWKPAPRLSLADRDVLIVGYGGVGEAIASRLLAFETNVTRVSRTPRLIGDDVVHGLDALPDLLPKADIVVIGIRLTPETTHLVNEDFLAAMPDESLLVNIARGRVADTEALVRHASSGRLRLALDVTDPEPLPSGHPLWALPNVLISPHVGGMTSAMVPRMARLIHNQVERMLAGESPLNVVLTT